MSQVADDLSVAWHQACDQVRSQLPSLSTGHQVWLFPSLEAALLEISQVLLDRNSEMGGLKQQVLLVRGQDPSLDVLASTVSSSGFDVRFCSIDEFLVPATVFDPIKSELLYVAYSSDSRFTGESFEFSSVAGHIQNSGSKVSVIRVGFEQKLDESIKPGPWEIVVRVLWGGAAIVLLGERLRVLPKIAPYLMARSFLEDVVRSVSTLGHSKSSRRSIESFEANLPRPFRPLHIVGAPRVLDRAVFTSQEFDGSYVRDELLAALSDQNGLRPDEIATTSGCWSAEENFKRTDERRFEWFRKNRRVWQNDLDVRGTVHISYPAIERIGSDRVLASLRSIISSHK